ncbi:MAG TPA: histidinol-phosphatase HisJ family protein [Coriobacteriia bacterium]|nr:histidinol-phosphatase HisJ family protein [Coriobacteriia bacterium]
MRELIDCHIHTERCGHASGTVAQMISAAVFAGLTGVVVTEHLPLPLELDSDHHLSMTDGEISSYAEDVNSMAARVKGLEVILGAEADWLPGREEFSEGVRLEARAAGVRVLLGSVHFLEDWAFDDPHELAEWENRSVDEVWSAYFAHWCDAARSGYFDVMAHPDLPKKFGHRPTFDLSELYDAAARAAAEGGVAIEVSTAGLRKPVAELYPAHQLLTAFADRGVPATVGSDAHATSEVGFGIPLAYDAMLAAGYERAALPLGGGEMKWVTL